MSFSLSDLSKYLRLQYFPISNIQPDASHPICGSRLAHILTSHKPISPSSTPSNPPNISALLSRLTHFSTPSLAHLLALLTHPTTSFPPQHTSLIVIESLSTLISNAFPRSTDASSATPQKPGASKPSSRKFPILQHLISSLSKLATTRNIVIAVTSQCVTKMRPGAGAVLVPAVNTTAWEEGLGCRVELMRDWGWEDEDGRMVEGVRLARVMKAEGVAVGGKRLVGFGIGATGLQPLALPIATTTTPTQMEASPQKCPPLLPSTTHPTPTTLLSQKRKLSTTDLEIPDSDAEDDEDYGWAEEDEEELPPQPPQWQGSEDALAPPAIEEDEGEGDEVQELAVGGVGRGREREMAKDVIDDSEDELA